MPNGLVTHPDAGRWPGGPAGQPGFAPLSCGACGTLDGPAWKKSPMNSHTLPHMVDPMRPNIPPLNNPLGSLPLIGSLSANVYGLTPPASPAGSSERNLPSVGSYHRARA